MVIPGKNEQEHQINPRHYDQPSDAEHLNNGYNNSNWRDAQEPVRKEQTLGYHDQRVGNTCLWKTEIGLSHAIKMALYVTNIAKYVPFNLYIQFSFLLSICEVSTYVQHD